VIVMFRKTRFKNSMDIYTTLRQEMVGRGESEHGRLPKPPIHNREQFIEWVRKLLNQLRYDDELICALIGKSKYVFQRIDNPSPRMKRVHAMKWKL